jgi:hypothetical protein
MRVRLWILCVTIETMLLHAQAALARAGGGGGYSSGGSSSSSSFGSSGGSSSGGSGEFTLFDLILLLGFLAFAIYAHRSRLVATRKAAAKRLADAKAISETLREQDPNFDLDRFSTRVGGAFHAIQRAWSEQDLESVRGFLSDGLHERFSIQVREQTALGYRNLVENVSIRECVVVEAYAEPHFDIVSVRITARATDVRVDTKTGRPIEGTRRAESFTEIWSFLRGHGARSEAGAGLLEGQCPNCAAPIDAKSSWSCESCGSDLEGAPPDWVLVEITQRSEWTPRAREEAAWQKAAIQRDPGLTAQQIEDRASVLFWRLMDAERSGSVDELASVARPAFLEHQRARIDAAGVRYLGDCAVGAVLLRGILPGEQWDLALVEVRWSGGTYLRRPKGPPEATGTKSLRRSLLVMARRDGTQSSIGRCIVSAHCPSCGAADEGALDGACTFCGVPLNDGSDWLIDRFPHWNDSDATMLLSELHAPRSTTRESPVEIEESATTTLPPDPGGLELFAWSLRVAYADQRFDRRERTRLANLAERLGIAPSEARRLRKAAQFGRLEVDGPGDADQTRSWLAELERLASCDGALSRKERAILDRHASS